MSSSTNPNTAAAANAVAAATEQFADMFTKLGGLMAERTTDLKGETLVFVIDILGTAPAATQ